MILIVILANIWVHWIFNPFKMWMIRNIKNAPSRYRPFDCESCMSFWVTAIYFLKTGEWWEAALYSGLAYFISSLVSMIFVLYLNKFYARAIKRFF